MKWTALVLFAGFTTAGLSQNTTASQEVDAVFADSRALYLDLHQNPELSSHETQTAAKLASRLRGAGYEVK